MATEIRGQDIILDLRPKGSTTWLTLTCLREYTLNKTTGELTTSNRCSGVHVVSRPNTVSYTVTFEGDMDVDPTAAQASYQQLAEWELAQETLEWRAYNADQTYYRSGEGWLSTTEESAPQDGFAPFSGTINGSGIYSIVPPVIP
ncbi:phage tail tube protein [Olivibacter sp. LS-1]|uniref:phage tail tube protein n=1 Tax=Olivibacter sp. LS-1 TaxID=2592345 RepID=UPI001FEE3408|nr:phage tail tube protein [Olivibacter sp. LS-1]